MTIDEQVRNALEALVAKRGERGTARLLRREEAGLRVTAQAVRNIRGGAGCTVRLADHILAVARGEQGQ